MKEEAQMVNVDDIMRYIRILSELSGQIKYSSQKRVLIEIALIKLAKPAMERDVSSLNNRIAILEKKIEEGKMCIRDRINPDVNIPFNHGMHLVVLGETEKMAKVFK